MPINRLAMLSVHTSPLEPLGGDKTGGMNVYIRELAQELGRRGIQVDIYTRRTSEDESEIDISLGANIRVIRIAAGPKLILDPLDIYPYLSQYTSSLIAFTMKHGLRYDLIYSHYWLSGWVASKLREIWGVPFVQMFHTLGHMKNRIAPVNAPALTSDLRVTTENYVARWASRIIAATPAEQAQLLWLYRADRRKIDIVPPGVNLDRFKLISMNQAKSNLGIPLDTNLLLFVGRIEPLKAVDTILEALSLIRQDNPDLLANLQFSVIGGRPGHSSTGELSRLERLSLSMGLGNIVKFLGAKDQELLPDYYAASVGVIMPSDYEFFGMVALEAMASGTPVIATEVGGLAYLVRHEETGFLVPARDSLRLSKYITALLVNPEKRKQMGLTAAGLAQRYTWSAIADQLLNIFDDVVKSSTSDASPHKS